jgi:hypothetical protein
MEDPNVTFKRDWAQLVEKLGRQPRVTDPEWRKLHEDYKNAFSQKPAEETLVKPNIASAAGPVDAGFSRKPAPQARTYTRESAGEGGKTAARARAIAAYVTGEPLSGPDKSNPREGAPITLSASISAPGGSHGLSRGARGPGGGLVYRCGACGRLWERKVGRGRPASKCEECR